VLVVRLAMFVGALDREEHEQDGEYCYDTHNPGRPVKDVANNEDQDQEYGDANVLPKLFPNPSTPPAVAGEPNSNLVFNSTHRDLLALVCLRLFPYISGYFGFVNGWCTRNLNLHGK
jgi:hypothetical protein